MCLLCITFSFISSLEGHLVNVAQEVMHGIEVIRAKYHESGSLEQHSMECFHRELKNQKLSVPCKSFLTI